MDGRRVVTSVCPLDCPDMCSLHVELVNDRIVSVNGDVTHPVTRGAICNKVRHMPERTYHPERLMTPLKRTGAKGTHAFEPISWEEAYDTIRSRFQTILDTYGGEAILPYSFYGNMGLLSAEGMDRRFFHRLGASQLQRSICNAAGAEGYQAVMGVNRGIDPEDTVHSKLIVVWGCDLVSTNMHQVMLAQEARRNGAKIVHIDVQRTRTSRFADWFIPVRPGTDGALALGLMNVLIREGMVDRAFIAEHTVGYEDLSREAMNYPPERVSEVTGVPAEDVIQLARMYGKTTPSFIRIGNGLQHHDNGGMVTRTIACLPALTGQWGKQGGGAMKGNGAFAAVNTTAVQRPDLKPYPAPRMVNMNQLGDALLTLNPPVKALFVYNSNPAQVAPDSTKVREGLLRKDLFTVVHDLFLTDTCKYADLVLPATSHFENLDFYKSYWHLYVQLHRPIIPVQGQCKSNFTLFRELASVMGFEDACFQQSEEDVIQEALNNPSNPYLAGISYEALQANPWVKLDSTARLPFPSNVPTPSGKIELSSEAFRARGLPTVPTHLPLAETSLFPLQFVPGPNHHFLNTTFGNVDSMQRSEGVPTLTMHPEDAIARGLADGDRVRVWNHRGACELHVRIAEDVLPGVVVSRGLWWENEEVGYQSVNILTSQRLADMGGGATFFSSTVEVEKLSQ